MMRLRATVLLALVASTLALSSPPAAASHCDPFAPTTVTTGDRTVVVPLPANVGPVTAGPVTVPLLLTVQGVPVVGTVTVGGQTVGPVSTGQYPTGLSPVVVIIHGQSAAVPLSATCLAQTLVEELNPILQPILDCIRDIRTCTATA